MAIIISSNTLIKAHMTIGYVTTGTTVVTTTLHGLILEMNPANIIKGTFSNSNDARGGKFIAIAPDSSNNGNTASFYDLQSGFGVGNTNFGCDQFGDPIANSIFVTSPVPYIKSVWGPFGFGINFGSASVISDLTASTWCTWIWTGSTGSMLFNKDDYSQGQNGGYSMGIHTDPADAGGTTFSGNHLRYWNANSSLWADINSNVLPSSTWVHYVVTSDGGGTYLNPNGVNFYINGVTSSQTRQGQIGAGAHYSDSGQPLYFGVRGTNAVNASYTGGFYGYIGLIQMYNRNLPQSEILSLYQGSNIYTSATLSSVNIVGYVVDTPYYINGGWGITYSCTIPLYSRDRTLGQLGYNNPYYLDPEATKAISGDNGRQNWAFATQSGSTSSIILNMSNGTWPDLVAWQQTSGPYNSTSTINWGYWIQSNQKVTVPATNGLWLDYMYLISGSGGSGSVYTFPFKGQIIWQDSGQTNFTPGLTYAWSLTAGSSASYLFTVATLLTDNATTRPMYNIVNV